MLKLDELSERERIVLRRALDAYVTREFPPEKHEMAAGNREIARDLGLRLG